MFWLHFFLNLTNINQARNVDKIGVEKGMEAYQNVFET